MLTLSGMINIFQKKYIILWIIWVGTILTAGCDRQNPANPPASDENDQQLIYATEYKDIDLKNDYGSRYIERDGFLYTFTAEYPEADNKTAVKLIKTDILTNTSEEIPLSDFPENTWELRMAPDESGNYIFLAVTPCLDKFSYILLKFSPNGQKLSEKMITDFIPQTNANDLIIWDFCSDHQGILYLIIQHYETGNPYLIAIDAEGNRKGIIECEGSEVSDGMSILINDDNDDIYVAVQNPGKTVFRKVDFAADSLEPEILLQGISNVRISLSNTDSAGLLVSDYDSLYQCDLTTGKCTQILDWLDSGVIAHDIRAFGACGEDVSWVLTNSELITLQPTADHTQQSKEIITYGHLFAISPDIQKTIIRFNQTNTRYRIETKSYDSGDNETDRLRYQTDLMTSNQLDIINMNNISYKHLAAKGVLADLYPYMNNDTRFHRDGYLENALTAYDIDGRLYGIMPFFYLNILAGRADLLRGIDHMNISEIIDFAERYPDAKLMKTNRLMILDYLCKAGMEQFMNRDTGTCDFTNDDFLRILEFSRTFPDVNDPEQIGISEGLNTGKYLLKQHAVLSLLEIQELYILFNGSPKLIGSPTLAGNGITFYPSGTFGMCARSEHKDGVWEFFSFLLSEESQELSIEAQAQGILRIPVKKSALDTMCERASEIGYHTDENGNETEMSKGFRTGDDYHFSLYASGNEEIALFRELINRASGVSDHLDYQITEIIFEESGGFFAGQKSATETADIIQNRVQLYMDENL